MPRLAQHRKKFTAAFYTNSYQFFFCCVSIYFSILINLSRGIVHYFFCAFDIFCLICHFPLKYNIFEIGIPMRTTDFSLLIVQPTPHPEFRRYYYIFFDIHLRYGGLSKKVCKWRKWKERKNEKIKLLRHAFFFCFFFSVKPFLPCCLVC